MSKNIHPFSDVQTSEIGENTIVWQFSIILGNAIIGSNCNINCHCFVENDVIIGNNVTIKSGVQIWDGVRIEDDVFIGPNVTFTNDLVPRSKIYPSNFKQTFIRKGVSIGGNATIVAGIEVGEYSFIGAGSVVTKTIPPYTIWYGNPARHQGYITENAVILDLDLLDKINHNQYILEGDRPVLK